MFRKRKTWIDELNELFRNFEVNSDSLFYPQMTNNGNVKRENYSNEMGDWEKETFTSNDGTFVQTKIYYKPLEPINDKQDPTKLSLKEQLRKAVENEEFEKAAELRDKIKKLDETNHKITDLKEKLQKAIDEEDFEEAIKLRDKIKKFKE